MASKEKKIGKHLHILLTDDQHQKLKMFAFYSNHSIGEIVRKLIDGLEKIAQK